MVTSCYGLSFLCQGFMFYDNSERVFSVSDGHLTVIGECCASVVNIASSNFFIFLFIM